LSLFRASIDGLVPYEPGKPVEAVQRELGLERVVKLASNEGPFPPFPARSRRCERARSSSTAIPTAASGAPDALAERHGVAFEELIVGAGADGIIDCSRRRRSTRRRDRLRLAVLPELRPHGREARRRGPPRPAARPHVRPRRPARRDRPQTKLVYVCHPTTRPGRAHGGASSPRSSTAARARPLRLDQAYFEYIDDPDYADGLELFREGAAVAVLRTFSKIYGLAGLRVGWAVGPADVVDGDEQGAPRVRRDARRRRRRAGEPRRRRGDRARAAAQREGRERLAEILREHGSSRSGRLAATSSSPTSAADATLFERCSARASSSGRSTASARPRRSASPSARRRRTSSSLSAWDTSFRASRNRLHRVVRSGAAA
jgi:histidinol-phosphate/aromatic aminotransferase/cobyric acid decarboxylase-like protein